MKTSVETVDATARRFSYDVHELTNTPTLTIPGCQRHHRAGIDMEQYVVTNPRTSSGEWSIMQIPEVDRLAWFRQAVEQASKQFGIEFDLSMLSDVLCKTDKTVSEVCRLYVEAKRQTTEGVETQEGQWNENTYNTESYYVFRFAKWAGGRFISHDLIREYWKTLPQKDKIAKHGGQKASPAKDADPTKRKQASIYAHQKRIRALCNWSEENGHISVNPFAGPNPVKLVSLRKEQRVVWLWEDVVAMVTCTQPVQWIRTRQRRTTRQQWTPDGPMQREALQARALLLALLDSAGRASEICQLDCRYARQAQAVIKGKGGHEGELYFVAETLDVLRELAGDRPDNDPLFRDWHGNRCSRVSLLRIIKRLAERASVELPADPLHSFRHLAARLWVEGGMNTLMIKAQLRHQQLQTTEIYTQQATGPVSKAHNAYSPIPALARAAGLVANDAGS